jgi:ATP-dependent DNA helicase RecG
MAWLDRTLPLAARFPPGQIFREDRLPVPPEALREVLLNAVMHRDYTFPGSYVAVAVFDDRIEVRSMGGLPRGVSAESLSRTHKSVLRNPLIAEAFHRTGAVEVWGRGTNRVIEECQRHGIEPPTFEAGGGFVVVTFRAQIGPAATEVDRGTAKVTTQVETGGRLHAIGIGQRAERILAILRERGPLSSTRILEELGESITQRALQAELKRLCEARVLVAIGKARATTYRAAEDKR